MVYFILFFNIYYLNTKRRGLSTVFITVHCLTIHCGLWQCTDGIGLAHPALCVNFLGVFSVFGFFFFNSRNVHSGLTPLTPE